LLQIARSFRGGRHPSTPTYSPPRAIACASPLTAKAIRARRGGFQTRPYEIWRAVSNHEGGVLPCQCRSRKC
jgi:hypothetical protein